MDLFQSKTIAHKKHYYYCYYFIFVGLFVFQGERQPLIDLRKKIEKGCAFDSIPLFTTEEALGKGRRDKLKRHSADAGDTSFFDLVNAYCASLVSNMST